jgi:hypothetical protein
MANADYCWPPMLVKACHISPRASEAGSSMSWHRGDDAMCEMVCSAHDVREVRHKVAIHHVDVQVIGARGQHTLALRRHVGQVAR